MTVVTVGPELRCTKHQPCYFADVMSSLDSVCIVVSLHTRKPSA